MAQLSWRNNTTFYVLSILQTLYQCRAQGSNYSRFRYVDQALLWMEQNRTSPTNVKTKREDWNGEKIGIEITIKWGERKLNWLQVYDEAPLEVNASQTCRYIIITHIKYINARREENLPLRSVSIINWFERKLMANYCIQQKEMNWRWTRDCLRGSEWKIESERIQKFDKSRDNKETEANEGEGRNVSHKKVNVDGIKTIKA